MNEYALNLIKSDLKYCFLQSNSKEYEISDDFLDKVARKVYGSLSYQGFIKESMA